jgi:hypothetical protein
MRMRNKMMRERRMLKGSGGGRFVHAIQTADSAVGNGYDGALQMKAMPNTMGG